MSYIEFQPRPKGLKDSDTTWREMPPKSGTGAFNSATEVATTDTTYQDPDEIAKEQAHYSAVDLNLAWWYDQEITCTSPSEPENKP